MIKNICGFKEIITEIGYVLSKKEKLQASYLLFLMIIGSALELLGVSAIVPFIQAVITPEQLKNGSITGVIWDLLNMDGMNYPIIAFGLLLSLVYVIKNFFLIYIAYMRFNYTTQWQKNLSIRMLRSYMARPYTYFLNVNSSEVLRGCSDDTNGFFDLLNYLFVFIMESVTVIIIGAYLIVTDFFTAIGVLALMAIVLGGMVIFFKPAIKKAGYLNVEALTERNKSITQAIQGIKDILVMQRREPFVLLYEKAADKARISNRNRNFIGALPDRVTEGVCISGTIGIVCIRILIGDDSIDAFIPKLAAFAMAAFKILPSVGKISNALNACMFGKPLQHNIYTNIKETEKYDSFKIENDRSRDTNLKQTMDKVKSIVDSDFVVEVSDVRWKYEGQKCAVLDSLSFSFKKGESIGLIGPSGAGKTTTADVLLGLLRPQGGSVKINNLDVFLMPKIWANIVGYVPQNVFLIDDTVRANIVFGLKCESDSQVWETLAMAQISEFIKTLPDGLDTVVGERGIKFSGGQRQRIAIARALYTKPQILVMDEATAALDNETENAVMEAIEALQGQMTLVIVAHRLTTIRKCDRVYEIKNGVAREITQNKNG
ncbi:MAG: ABC transporter ATP-binding protein [Butyrivibrio sp.]|nr:ABC transporter ATP-binding protein [Butyrivibrio sp.]